MAIFLKEIFEKKINDIVVETTSSSTVYNRRKKIFETSKNFMTSANIMEAITNLKVKNSEGFDRIPQRI